MMNSRFYFSLIGSVLLSACSPASNAYNASNSTQPIVMQPQQMLAAHNKVRANYKLPPLSWSPQLANFAQQWATHLQQHTACQMQHRPHSGQNKTDYGENLFWASPVRWSDGHLELQHINPARVVTDWASESRYFNYRSNRCQPGQQCGHFTQLVWRDTKQVGCGVAVCADKSQVWVCSYNPAGNWQGERPY